MREKESIRIQKKEYASSSRRRVVGVLFLMVSAFIWLVFGRTTDTALMTTFNLTPGGTTVLLPDWVFPSVFALDTVAVICAGLGTYQLFRGFGKFTNALLGLVAGILVFSFLAWGAAGGSINVVGMLRVMVIRAVPMVIGALSGIVCERAGVVNIAIEGMMLIGAFVSAVFGSAFGSWVGVVVSIIAGGLIGLLHAVLSIKYKVNQIISGTVINIISTGLTSFLASKFLQQVYLQTLNNPKIFQPIEIPFLSKIPLIGSIFFSQNVYAYFMYGLVIVLTIALFYTRWGLRLRSVGEHPKAADTLGINVFRTRYFAVMLSGMLAGFAGSYFTLGSVGRFNEMMTGGRGFISLAAMIFGNWTPVGALGSGMLFGFADSLSGKLNILRFPIPSYFLMMLPYIVTMIVLAGVVGRSQGPAAAGTPYEKESL